MDNISVDIDFSAIEAEHERVLQLYKAMGKDKDDTAPPSPVKDEVPQLVPATKPLIPINKDKPIATGAGYFGRDALEEDREMKLLRFDSDDYDDEMTKFYNEPDPQGRKVKGFQGFQKGYSKPEKPNIWEPHAWGESSDEEQEINSLFDKLDRRGDNASDGEFTEFTDNYGDDKQDTKDQKWRSSTVAVNGLLEKADEMGVSMDKLTADVAEISRDVSEILPSVDECKETVCSIKTEQVRIQKRLATIESTLADIKKSVASLSGYMEIICAHITTEDLT